MALGPKPMHPCLLFSLLFSWSYILARIQYIAHCELESLKKKKKKTKKNPLYKRCYALNVGVLTPKFICWNPTLGCDGIRMWGLWEVIRWWEWNPHEWRVPCKGMKRPREAFGTPWESWSGLQTSVRGSRGGGVRGASLVLVQELQIPHAVKNQNKQKERERKTEAFPLPCEDMGRRWPAQKKGECWPTGGRVIYQESPQFWKQMLFLDAELKVRLTMWFD